MTDTSPYTRLKEFLSRYQEKHSRAPMLVTMPRQLAARLVGDYAAETQRDLNPRYFEGLMDDNRPEFLLCINGQPVVCGPMLAPLIAGYGERGACQALRELEECKDHPGLPWYQFLAEKDPYEMASWVKNAVLQARKTINEHGATYWEPASDLMPDGWLEKEEAAKKPERTPLSDDAAIALQEAIAAFEDKRQTILNLLDSPDGFQFGMRNLSPELCQGITEWFRESFAALVETQRGDYGITHFKITRMTLQLN